MTRKEFIKKSLVCGVGLPFINTFLSSCEEEDVIFPEITTDFSGDVIIVGAGAAGLAAGYLLQHHNINFQILEASSGFGGRVRRNNDFADFPIDIGAEWIHTSPTVLADILRNSELDASIDFVTYNPQTIATAKDGKLTKHNYASNFYSEYKFKSTTWYGFFERFMLPEIEERIIYEQPINQIDTNSNRVRLTALDNTQYVSLQVLKLFHTTALYIGLHHT